MQSTTPTLAILAEFRGLTDCSVRLVSGATVPAVMDVAALRKRHGPIYNINLGATVEVESGTPLRIVSIEQAA